MTGTKVEALGMLPIRSLQRNPAVGVFSSHGAGAEEPDRGMEVYSEGPPVLSPQAAWSIKQIIFWPFLSIALSCMDLIRPSRLEHRPTTCPRLLSSRDPHSSPLLLP